MVRPGSQGWTIVDIIVHLGAHRTATTTFQHFLRKNTDRLHLAGVAVWTPDRTRSGLFSGLIERPQTITDDVARRGRRSCGLIAIEMARLRQAAVRQLIVSEENMIGSVRNNLGVEQLYPRLSDRLIRFRAAFGDAPLRIALSIRSYDAFWASSFAHALRRGSGVPDAAKLDRLVAQPRRWRNVITDIARTWPGADLIVLPFERYAGRPEAYLAQITGDIILPGMTGLRDWQNPSPRRDALRAFLTLRGDVQGAEIIPPGDARWMPFDAGQQAVLRSAYRADLDWLADGADGLARMAGETLERSAKIPYGKGGTGDLPHPPVSGGGRGFGRQGIMV